VMIVGGNQMMYIASRYYDYANKMANGFMSYDRIWCLSI
jgi:hypothetical protein